jgi:uncharacterized protein involved in outer membrane biogenesis
MPIAKPLRVALICVAVLIALPLLAAAAFVLSFDANAYKGRITDAVRRATGRELVLAGPLSLTPSLTPTLEARDVALANMAGGSRPQMLSIGRLQARIKLLPLLSRRVEIDSVTLLQPDILLETDANGRGNWQFDHPAAAASEPAAPSAPTRRAEVDLRHVHVQDGRLTVRRGSTGQSAAMDVPVADLDLGDGPLHVTAALGYAGLPFDLDLGAGTLAQMQGNTPLNLRIVQGDAAVSYNGTADVLARRYQGQAEIAVPDTTRFADLAGRPGLPVLHDVRAKGDIASAFGIPLPSNVTVHFGAADLQGVLPGLSVTQLDATLAKFGDAARIVGNGQMSGAPWTLTSGVVPAGGGVALRGMAATLGGSDVAGDLAVTLAAVPTIRGTLVSKQLDFDALRGLLRRPLPAAAPASAAIPVPPQATEAPLPRVISDRKLPFDALRRVNGDLQISAGDVRMFGADYTGVAAHTILRNGALTLDPVTVQAPEGHIDLSFSADASQSPPPVVLNLQSAAFALRPLLQSLGLPSASDAAVDVGLAVHSAGDTPRALAAALTGHAGLAMVDGEVENALFASLLGNVLKTANVPLGGAGRSHVRCLAIRLDAEAGHVEIHTLKLDSARLEMDGGGAFDLGAETLALKLRPELRIGGTSVLAPVQVGGTFAHPQPGLDSLGGPGRAGVLIGGAAPADTCAADLAAARDGHAGPLPAAAQPAKRDVKPADLLRSFLR